MYLPAEADYGREPAFRCYIGEQELGVKFAYLILNRYNKRGFDCRIHPLFCSPIWLQATIDPGFNVEAYITYCLFFERSGILA
jgi:hypothetical protein